MTSCEHHDCTSWTTEEVLKGNNYDICSLILIDQCLSCGHIERAILETRKTHRYQIHSSAPARFDT